ncbi:hypothetical protein MCETOYE15_00457 [Candidatus Nanopelagicaceae bacterium]
MVMSGEEPVVENQAISSQESVARSILGRFPNASLQMRESQSDTIYEIYFQEKLLLCLDKKGARYFFPSRRKRILKWDKITTFGIARIIDYIVRDLAEANYEVLSSTNKQVLKRPIHISRLMRCPQCKQGGGIRIIVRGETLAAENSEIYTTISASAGIDGAEIKCTLCGWIGVPEELLRKIRKPRSS